MWETNFKNYVAYVEYVCIMGLSLSITPGRDLFIIEASLIDANDIPRKCVRHCQYKLLDENAWIMRDVAQDAVTTLFKQLNDHATLSAAVSPRNLPGT